MSCLAWMAGGRKLATIIPPLAMLHVPVFLEAILAETKGTFWFCAIKIIMIKKIILVKNEAIDYKVKKVLPYDLLMTKLELFVLSPLDLI